MTVELILLALGLALLAAFARANRYLDCDCPEPATDRDGYCQICGLPVLEIQ